MQFKNCIGFSLSYSRSPENSGRCFCNVLHFKDAIFSQGSQDFCVAPALAGDKSVSHELTELRPAPELFKDCARLADKICSVTRRDAKAPRERLGGDPGYFSDGIYVRFLELRQQRIVDGGYLFQGLSIGVNVVA